MVSYMLEKKKNRIFIAKRYGVNILPINTLKELGITREELGETFINTRIQSRELQGICSIKLYINI